LSSSSSSSSTPTRTPYITSKKQNLEIYENETIDLNNKHEAVILQQVEDRLEKHSRHSCRIQILISFILLCFVNVLLLGMNNNNNISNSSHSDDRCRNFLLDSQNVEQLNESQESIYSMGESLSDFDEMMDMHIARNSSGSGSGNVSYQKVFI